MKLFKLIAFVALGASLSGCAAFDSPSGNSFFGQDTQHSFQYETADGTLAPLDVSVVDVREVVISVPQSLVVSEANSYYPPGDIVWRGDPIGDRHKQVKALFVEGIGRGTANLNGSVPVILDIQVERFHSVTEKTRYTFGGVHSIRFSMSLRDARTGKSYGEPKIVKADLKAYGGQAAVDAELAGQTQKVRVVAHLAEVIQKELGRPVNIAQGTPTEVLVVQD